MSGIRILAACCILCCTFSVQAESARSNPLGEVITLLNSLAAKITKDGEAEAKAYKDYYEWCDDAATAKKQDIETASTKKAALEATIAKQAGIAATASTKIEELAASIAKDDADLKEATGVRATEAADFASEEAELSSVISTLTRAVAIVEKQMAKNPAALAQVDTSSLDRLVTSLTTIVDATAFSGADKKKLLALVQSQQGADADDEDAGAPAGAVYKTSSTGVVDVLEDLKEKAEEQLESLRKTEANALHNFGMLKMALDNQIAADTKALGDEKISKATAEQEKAAAEGELSGTVKDLEEGESVLETIKGDCMHTAADHEATVTARTEELKVIAKAKEILSSSTSGAVSQTYSLLQLGAGRHEKSAVVAMIKRLAKEEHSTALAQLASRISTVMQYGAAAGEDPFVKVKDLISGLISKLEEEKATAASEKAYCDEQLSKTSEKKGELEYDIEKLSTKIDAASAKSTSLKEEVKGLEAELAALAKSQADMDAIRGESHADYVAAKEDLEEGLSGVRNALGLLRDYYGGASAAALLQDADADAAQQPAVPEAHVKATGAGSSIIGILEVVESDFAKNLATVETQEADEESEYARTTQDNKVTKTLKDQDVKYKTQEYKALDKSLTELSSDRESKDAELSAVADYLEKIKGRCTATAETYEERKAKRESEIEGLKHALTVLESETAFVQRRGRRQHGRFLAPDTE